MKVLNGVKGSGVRISLVVTKPPKILSFKELWMNSNCLYFTSLKNQQLDQSNNIKYRFSTCFSCIMFRCFASTQQETRNHLNNLLRVGLGFCLCRNPNLSIYLCGYQSQGIGGRSSYVVPMCYCYQYFSLSLREVFSKSLTAVRR